MCSASFPGSWGPGGYKESLGEGWHRGRLKAVMPQDEASHYNQGLIEIGALVCIPGRRTQMQPVSLASICLTRKNGWWKEIPYKSPAKARKIEERTVLS